MKKYILTSIIATGILILVFAVDGRAQSAPRLVADIPFDFFVRNEKMPAGRYEFEPASRNAYPASLVVRSLDKSSARSVFASALADDGGRFGGEFVVVFMRYGYSYYLSSVNHPGSDLALKLVKTSSERKLARTFRGAVPITIRPTAGAGN